MAETEVEIILREIRERVLSQQRAGNDPGATAAARATIRNEGNGASDSVAPAGDPPNAEALALINSYLTTTARAWDRLPPLVSNRSDLAARIELWLKRRLKAGTRWFTWEQVNFNAAVHHALRDLLPVFAAYEQELRKLYARIQAETDLRRFESEQQQSEITARRAELRTEIAKIHAAIEAQRTETEARAAEVNSLLAGLVSELRERDERLQGEQRVSFKQLALETTEAAVLEDRARRKTETLLQELSHRVEQLEK